MVRVAYWNISHGWLIDVLAAPALAALAFGFRRHWKLIRRGRARRPRRAGGLPGALNPALLIKAVLGLRLYQDLVPGLCHGLLLWGMALLFLGTFLILLNILFGLPVFEGRFNVWFTSFGLDLAGLAALIGLGGFLFLRASPKKRLEAVKSKKGFVLSGLWLLAVIVSGFLVEGLRLSLTGPEEGAFVGNLLAPVLGHLGGQGRWHALAWWAHGLGALGLIASIPFSPLRHLILVPLNAAVGDDESGIKMEAIDFEAFEDEEAVEPGLGVAALAEFDQKSLLDFAACVWCGRCHEVCPAVLSQKSLSPKGVIITLAEYLAREWMNDASLLEAVGPEAIFECRTCAACLEVCPAYVKQPQAIGQLRRHLVMERSEMPDVMAQALKSLEARQHPFFGTGAGPRDWRRDIEAPLFEAGRSEYLLWTGCAVTYEERAQAVARAMVRILEAAGVSFGILEESRCTGDPAKQMGHDFLFFEIARQNIEDLDTLGVRKIITLCPHCYTSFDRDYRDLGADYEVIAHPVLLSRLIKTGALTLTADLEEMVFHDPCYLARHNRIVNEPREVLASAGRLIEMKRSRTESLCCGGGGGNYWSEEAGERINQLRAQEALESGAKTVVTACPFCLLMLTDGVKKYTADKVVFDLAEIVSSRLRPG